MRNLYLKTLIGLLTLSLGIVAGSAWTRNTSIDSQLNESLRKVYVRDSDQRCDYFRNKVVTSSVKPKPSTAEEINERVERDLRTINQDCLANHFTVSKCDGLKAKAVKDIKENILVQK